MAANDHPAPHHETPTFGNPDLPPEGMVNTTGDPASTKMTGPSAHLNVPGDILAKFPRGAQGIVPLP
jgi:hypothetical protein